MGDNFNFTYIAFHIQTKQEALLKDFENDFLPIPQPK
jgi:hypothetical protein